MLKKNSFFVLYLFVVQMFFPETVNLIDSLNLKNMEKEYDVSENILFFKNDIQEIYVGKGLPYILIDGNFIYLDGLIKNLKDEFHGKNIDNRKFSYEENKTQTCSSQNDLGEIYLHETKPDKILINAIVVDAGHGGKDAGAFRGNLLEKNITLQVSKKINDLLIKKYSDKKILLTRNTDIFLSLDKRSEIANNISMKYGTSIFVSVHVNASKSPKAYGFETWYIVDSYKRNVIEKNKVSNDKDINNILNSMINEELYEESKTFAMKVQNALNQKIGKETLNRGVKENVYFVVKNSFMPAILVEIGFLSNKHEATQLTNDAYLNKVAAGIVNGIGEFINEYENFNRTKE